MNGEVTTLKLDRAWRDKIWKWFALGLITIIVSYWISLGWQWKRMIDDRLGRLEAAVVKMHPELAQRPLPQPSAKDQ